MFNKKNHHTSLFPDQAANNSQTQGKPLRLSPTSGLNLYNDCTRCFWLHYNGRVPRPRGIFPSLPGGMDLVIKDYFDEYRGALPPELQGRIKGDLMKDVNLMNQWRNWRTGLEYFDKQRNAVLFGALDECLVHDGKYVPLDYKTRGSAPNDGYSERYYQTQLDAYALMLILYSWSEWLTGSLFFVFGLLFSQTTGPTWSSGVQYSARGIVFRRQS